MDTMSGDEISIVVTRTSIRPSSYPKTNRQFVRLFQRAVLGHLDAIVFKEMEHVSRNAARAPVVLRFRSC